MKRISIFWLGHYFWDSRIFYKQAKSLSSEFQIECVWGFFSEKKWVWEEEEIKNIWLSGNRFAILAKAWWYGIQSKSDIYVAHDIDSYIVLILIKIFRWKSKIVFDSHEYYENFDSFDIENLSFLEKFLLKVFIFIVKPLTIFLFSWVTVVTEDMKIYYPQKKKEVIYNFPLSDDLSQISVDDTLSEKYKDNFILIFQWWVVRERWIMQYLEIVSLIKNDIQNIKLLIIGKINEEKFAHEISEYITKNNLELYIELIPKLPLFEVYKYTKLAHIWLNFLEPSFNNNHGIQIKLFEYLSLETPIIGTNNNKNFIRFISDFDAWIAINYGNIEQWIKAVKDIYNNYDYYKNNCIKIKNNYIWKNEEIKLLNFYNTL